MEGAPHAEICLQTLSKGLASTVKGRNLGESFLVMLNPVIEVPVDVRYLE